MPLSTYLLCLFTAILAWCTSPAPAVAQETAPAKGAITGHLKGYLKPDLIFQYNYKGEDKMEKVPVLNGHFSFSAEIDEPVIVSIYQISPVKFILAPGSNLTLEGDTAHIENILIKGDRHNEVFNEYKTKAVPLHILEKNAFRQSMVAASGDRENRANDFAKVLIELEKWDKEFIVHHTDAFVSVYLLAELLSNADFPFLNESFKRFPPEYQRSYYGKRISARINELRTTATGMPVPEFTLTDINGKQLSLADFRGKYVLLDFWGSWCKPCRRTHRHMNEVYEKYKPHGLVLVGISNEKPSTPGDLKTARASWLKAIEEDSISHWLHLLNNESIKKTDLVKTFAVNIFPTKILIDKDGKVLARFFGAYNDLDEKLKEIFEF